MLCDIYKGTKKAEMYLYVPLNNGFKDVPNQLLESFGELELVMKLELTKAKKLARVDAATVIQEILDKGYYLQVPPASWNGSMSHVKEES